MTVGIGDINSTEKGSGARFNSGKPDMSLIPLKIMALALPAGAETWVLYHLGLFQGTHESKHLVISFDYLGDAGWEECARVFEYGRVKYAAWNWAKGMPWSVPLACAVRHLLAMTRGETVDPESGLPHRGHVFCNIVMLLTYTYTYQEGNDLPPKELLPTSVAHATVDASE